MSLKMLSTPFIGAKVKENCCTDKAQRMRRAIFVCRRKDRGLWSICKMKGFTSKYFWKKVLGIHHSKTLLHNHRIVSCRVSQLCQLDLPLLEG
ncbi:hypothetical protein PoB_003535300 [Plakobranchus ocellatus]|uniref:Uncharacterized protein n=1 Tax=Plakobranchus ocellatus TaxID=259542 RepID=A0AAV4AQK4_9GAST|nr:hypothetical protein PoB_003535300 [Plakobranchus ocellatus]